MLQLYVTLLLGAALFFFEGNWLLGLVTIILHGTHWGFAKYYNNTGILLGFGPVQLALVAILVDSRGLFILAALAYGVWMWVVGGKEFQEPEYKKI